MGQLRLLKTPSQHKRHEQQRRKVERNRNHKRKASIISLGFKEAQKGLLKTKPPKEEMPSKLRGSSNFHLSFLKHSGFANYIIPN